MHVLVVGPRAAQLARAPAMARARNLGGCWVWLARARDAALSLEREAFDAVVVDVRAPDGGAIELLEQVRAESPRTLRVAVAADAGHPFAPWRYAAAHRCVEPHARALVDALERSRALRRRLRVPDIAATLERGRWPRRAHLPAHGRLMADGGGRRGARWISDALASSPEVTDVLARRVGVEPSGASGRAAFDDAMARWGIVRAVSAAMAVEIYAAIEREVGPNAHWIAAERREAWLVAETAASLASPGATAELAFAAGLCLELGRLFLAAHRPQVAEAVATAGVDGHELCAFERDLLGFDHAELGAAMLDALDVPHAVVEAVAEHHDPGWDGAGLVPTAAPGTASFACHVAAGLVAEAAGHGSSDDVIVRIGHTVDPRVLARRHADVCEALSRGAA